jgi:hypothetical protein
VIPAKPYPMKLVDKETMEQRVRRISGHNQKSHSRFGSQSCLPKTMDRASLIKCGNSEMMTYQIEEPRNELHPDDVLCIPAQL